MCINIHGGFLTMHLYGYSRIVINPCWDPATELPLIDYTGPTEEYERLRHSLVEELDSEEQHLCSGCFAPLDELLCTKYLEIFQQFFNRTYIIPGGHQVSAEAVVKIVNEIIPDTNIKQPNTHDNLLEWTTHQSLQNI